MYFSSSPVPITVRSEIYFDNSSQKGLFTPIRFRSCLAFKKIRHWNLKSNAHNRCHHKAIKTAVCLPLVFRNWMHPMRKACPTRKGKNASTKKSLRQWNVKCHIITKKLKPPNLGRVWKISSEVPFHVLTSIFFLLLTSLYFVQMVPGVLIMTTYKLVIIPHKLAQRGMSAQGDSSGTDERYLPFGHLPKEFLQV